MKRPSIRICDKSDAKTGLVSSARKSGTSVKMNFPNKRTEPRLLQHRVSSSALILFSARSAARHLLDQGRTCLLKS